MTSAARAETWLAAAGVTRRGRRVAAALLVATTAGLLLLRLGATPVERSAEVRTRAVASHMLESGDWLVPVMDGIPRVQKPPLYYWLGAGAGALNGALTPFALRLPAALCALGLLVVVMRWGDALGGPAAGGTAAFALLCMNQFWSVGRRGVAEMPLALCGATALFLFDRIYFGGRRRLAPAFFGVVLLGLLTKATAALLVIGLPIAVQLARDRAFGRLWRADLVVWALLALLGSLLWYVAIWFQVPEGHALLREALLLPLGLVGSSGSAAHVRPPWFFLETFPIAALPAIAFAPLALLRVDGRSAAFREPRTRFASVGLISLFLAFSALPMKQRHYMAPLLPLLAVAMGSALPRVIAARRAAVNRALRALALLWPICGPPLALTAVAHLWIAREGPPALGLAVAVLLLAASATGYVAGRGGHLRLFALSLLLVNLVGHAFTEASFDVWRARFDSGEVAAADTGYWQGVFERHPVLRRLYRADDWDPEDPDQTPRTEPRGSTTRRLRR